MVGSSSVGKGPRFTAAGGGRAKVGVAEVVKRKYTSDFAHAIDYGCEKYHHLPCADPCVVHNLGSAEEKCWESTSGSPLCIGFLCKATCFIAGKMFNSVVKEHRCMGSAFNSQCYCYLCDK
ncbi:hypothetical protein ZWY2020_011223 [Hordeum vulgare]|nr:hypothetical protein ZWY2020_011223 [Hordeum vulgare]